MIQISWGQIAQPVYSYRSVRNLSDSKLETKSTSSSSSFCNDVFFVTVGVRRWFLCCLRWWLHRGRSQCWERASIRGCADQKRIGGWRIRKGRVCAQGHQMDFIVPVRSARDDRFAVRCVQNRTNGPVVHVELIAGNTHATKLHRFRPFDENFAFRHRAGEDSWGRRRSGCL